MAGLPFLLSVLTVLGAAYLIWLGVSTVRRPPVLHAAGGRTPIRPCDRCSRGSA
ncbi:threonine/homoserine/homoserine lactone efflux protein [Kribbella aluminosa]|uniref:Threonine/homoserine/homoserine lactone efflux protein n=1 Tax=Kribbella aluminosa TaxID=416017 RepID=A0ABS4UXP8_9ACTN|nr:hypothetical protein [Kribbella aluminosa]MBP2356442.1 threonine/homoserine/homoserine lactone efflux protein [Kribbella aluminosa]